MNKSMDTINLAFICDDKYALCTGVAITSLKRNRNVDRKYRIYIIADKVSEQSYQLFLELQDKNFDIEIIRAERIANYSSFGQMKFAMHVSTAALYKFNLPEILSQTDKVLYMDGDIIIRDSLEALYDIDVSEHYAAVCKDIGAETFPSPFNKRLKINHSGYFNSGVMLLNLKLLRENHISERLIDYKKNGINHFMDQDALNVVFEENVVYFSFLYNMAVSCWRNRDSEQLAAYYELPGYTIDQFFKEAKVIHCSAPEKPWLYSNAIAAEEWLINFINSPFRKQELRRTQFEARHKLMTNGCTFDQIAYCASNTVNVSPEISVIIPVYNASKFLRDCIESLLCQTFSDAEFIFVDDGSTDDSWEILQHYAKLDCRVRIYQQENQRAGIARNNGMSHARGEYITFLDSDDMMLPDALEALHARAKETGSDIVLASAYNFGADPSKRTVAGWCLDGKYLPKEESFSVKDHAKYIFQITAGAPWGKIYRTQFIREHGINFPSAPRAEDFYFVYWALAVAKSISVLKKQIILYRILPGSGSLEDIKDDYPLAQTEVRKLLWEKLNEIGVYKKVEQSFVNGTINGTGYHLRGFKTTAAFKALFHEFKDVLIPMFNINMEDPSYFYDKNEYKYTKAIYDAANFEDFWFKKYKGLKGDTDYYWRELQRAKKELEASKNNPSTAQSPAEMAAMRALASYKLELEAVKSSWSFKIGRFITFIPRKIRGGIRCLQENGFRYTAKRVLVHLRLVDDPYKAKPSSVFGLLRRAVRCYREHGLAYTVNRVKVRLPHPFPRKARPEVKRDYEYYLQLPAKKYPEELALWYEQSTGEELNLEKPKTFNEKMQWLKLYDNTPLKTKLADKYLVRDWIKEKIGEEYLIPLLGVWDNFDEIDFDKLPDQFVLKTNHGSGWNLIVKDKSKLDINKAREKFNKWMKINFAFVAGFELHYMNVPPKIIAEEYKEELGQLYDYKFMCFDGEVKFIWVDTDRFTGHRRTLFTTSWERMDALIQYPAADYDIARPQKLDEMLKLAEKLSQGFAHVRVDFYEANGVVYFGEMTFTSTSGLDRATPREFEYEMGSWIKLPPKKSYPKRKI